MRFRRCLVACLAAMVFPGSANAILMSSAEDISGQLGATAFSGVGRMGLWSGPGTLVEACTGSLIASNVILTAAHCLGAGPDSRFVLGEGANEVGFRVLGSSSWGDLAVARLDGNAGSEFKIYDIYTKSDEIGKVFTMVGAGFTGTLATGLDFALDDGRMRYGYNTYDVTGADYDYAFERRFHPSLPAPTSPGDLLYYDNDNGLPQNDVFGRYLGLPGTGVVIDGVRKESSMSYGDSGGPDFIDGLIAGVHSIGFSGSEWERRNQRCGTAQSVDPVPPNEAYGCDDDSAGDVGASVRVSVYQNEIRQFLAASAVPEPATWGMMGIGLFAVGGAVRTRRGGRRARRRATA